MIDVDMECPVVKKSFRADDTPVFKPSDVDIMLGHLGRKVGHLDRVGFAQY